MEKKRILVIDDEASVTQTLKLYLEKTGAYEVLEENRAPEGLTTIRQFKPDLVLLDVFMPEVTGGEIAEQIKSSPDVQDTPIVFLTAAVTREEISKQGTIIGSHPFLAKPVTMRELIECIKKYVKK